MPSISEFQALEEEEEEKTKEQELIVASMKMADRNKEEEAGKQTCSWFIWDVRADLGHAKVDQDQSGPVWWDHEVRRFQVSVQHARPAAVQHVDTYGCLMCKPASEY